MVVSAKKKIAVLFEDINTSVECFDKRRNQDNKRVFVIK